MPNFLFLIFVVIVLFTLHGYVIFRALPVIGLNNNLSILMVFFTAIISFLPILPSILRIMGFENRAIDKFSLIGYTSFGFFSFTFMIFLFRDLFINIVSVTENLFKFSLPVDDTKRDFLIKLVIVTVGGVVSFTTLSSHPRNNNINDKLKSFFIFSSFI
mgnify:CR=1 FL=1